MPYYEHHFVELDAVSDLTPREWATLEGLLRALAPATYVEVGVGHLGTFVGVAARVDSWGMATRCHGIDAFGVLPPDVNGENSHEGDVISLTDARAHLDRLAYGSRCTLHPGDTSSILEELLPTIEHPALVFIDANHTYEGCLADFRAVARHARAGDVVLLHDTHREQHPDYGRGPRGVIEDVVLGRDEYVVVQLPAADESYTDESDSFGVIRIRSSPPAPVPVDGRS